MAVSKNIGFFNKIIQNNKLLMSKNTVRPVRPTIMNISDYNMLMSMKLPTQKILDVSKTFHWNFHKWGDPDNLVGK